MGSGTDRFAISAPDVRCVTSSHSWFNRADEFAVERFAPVCVENDESSCSLPRQPGLAGRLGPPVTLSLAIGIRVRWRLVVEIAPVAGAEHGHLPTPKP